MEINIYDEFSPWAKWIIEKHQEWKGKALKSAGWYMQQEIKKAIRSGAPGGQPYSAGIGQKLRAQIDKAAGKKYEGRKPKSRYPTLGKLVNAVGYDKSKVDQGIITVGWLSQSAVWLGSLMEKGGEKQVTPKVRRLLFSAGLFVSKGTNKIVIPKRPTYDPMAEVLLPKMPGYMEDKILDYWFNGAPTASTMKRKYTVHGGGFGVM